LAQHPEAEESLAAEVRQVLGDRDPTFEDCARLKYTEMVALEVMRLFPPAYTLAREALADCVIGDYAVRRGTTVLMSQWVVQRDPRFFRDPERFRPERWNEEAISGLPKFAYFPFGGGQRLCIGNTFAMMELVLVLATIAQRFRFRMQPNARVTPAATFTLRPSPGIPAEIVVRRGVSGAAKPRDSQSSSRGFIDLRVRSGSKRQLIR
jgi:cytochrome P450